jgi:hypothetical protein
VNRDPARLTAAAERVQADLRRTTGRPWACSVDSEFVLRVTDGVADQRLLLESAVEDEDWFAPSDVTAEELSAGLDADADELLASEVAEALRTLGITWPACVEHRRVMGACEGWWYCEGDPYHDVAEVGALEQEQVSPAV